MKVQVLSHMPFAGKQRKPGDTISQDVWMGATEAVRSSLVNGGYVRIGDGPTAGSQGSESSTDTIELLQGISAKQDRILSLLEGKPVKAPAKKRRKSPAKKPKTA